MFMKVTFFKKYLMKNVSDSLWIQNVMLMERTSMGEYLFIRSRTDGNILIKFDTPVLVTKNLHRTSLILYNIKVLFALTPEIGETLQLVSKYKNQSNHGN
jgi:hypothetical protein